MTQKQDPERMTTEHTKRCTVEGCGRCAVARGLCGTHYAQFRKSPDFAYVEQEPQGCAVPGCAQPHYALGWCRTHYRVAKRHDGDGAWQPPPVEPVLCAEPGCSAEAAARGLCPRHYAVMRRRPGFVSSGKGRLQGSKGPDRRCTEPGCEEPHWARGWCRFHYARWRHNGDPTHERSAILRLPPAGPVTYDTDLAWLGGFFDGEGCIGLARHVEETGAVHFRLVMQLDNTDVPTLDHVRAIMDRSGLSYNVAWHRV